jgi:uncharacterized protein
MEPVANPSETVFESIESARVRGLDLSPARKLLEEIVSQWDPLQIWLFGSRSRGTATADSDWDLLVIVRDETKESEIDLDSAWRIRVEGGVSADVIPCRDSEFRAARDVVNTLSYEAAHNGILAYGRD